MALIGAIRALLRVADLRTMTIAGLFVASGLFVFFSVNTDLIIIIFWRKCQPSWITQICGGDVRISGASRVAIIMVTGLYALPALAELPLTVEDLVTDKGKFKLDASFSYANVDRNGVSAGEPIQVQTGPTSFVQVPTAVGERSSNRDTLVGTVGLRYGITGKTEILARTSYLHTSERVRENARNSGSHQNYFADTWIGVNHKFREDGEHPALLGFAEVALSQRLRSSSRSFRSAILGFTTYKAIDPVVFSLTGAYRFNRNYRDGESTAREGNLLMLNPSIGFAVNDRVTLTTGMQWTRQMADRVNGRASGINRTATHLQLGVGYAFASGNTLNATLKSTASGNRGAEMRVNWLYTF